MDILGVPNTCPGWLRAASDLGRAMRSFLLLVNCSRYSARVSGSSFTLSLTLRVRTSLRFQGRAPRRAPSGACGYAAEVTHSMKRAPRARRETRHTIRRPLALTRQRTAAAAEARTPRQLAAPVERQTATRVRTGHPLGAAIIEAEQDHPQGRCARKPTHTVKESPVNGHAKTALTLIFNHLQLTPVGRMTRLGLTPLDRA